MELLSPTILHSHKEHNPRIETTSALTSDTKWSIHQSTHSNSSGHSGNNKIKAPFEIYQVYCAQISKTHSTAQNNQHQRCVIQHRKISTESPQRFPTVRLKMWCGGEILQHNKQWIRHTTHTRRERRGCGGDLIW